MKKSKKVKKDKKQKTLYEQGYEIGALKRQWDLSEAEYKQGYHDGYYNYPKRI